MGREETNGNGDGVNLWWWETSNIAAQSLQHIKKKVKLVYFQLETSSRKEFKKRKEEIIKSRPQELILKNKGLKIIGDITTDLFACYYRMTWPSWTWDVWHIEQEKGWLLV